MLGYRSILFSDYCDLYSFIDRNEQNLHINDGNDAVLNISKELEVDKNKHIFRKIFRNVNT